MASLIQELTAPLEKPPLVSVIIVSFNNEKIIGDCLSSVFNSNYPNFEVILIDNGSTDGTLDTVKKRFGSISYLKLIGNSENLGYAEGCNIGAGYAEGEYLAFLNSDTEVDPNWLNDLVKVIRSDWAIGAAQSKLLYADNHEQIWACGEFIDPYGSTTKYAHNQEDKGQYDYTKEIFNCLSTAMIVRRKLFEEVGMFDPKFFLYHEDVDIGWRIWIRGYKNIFVPKSVVFHKVGYSTRKEVSSFRVFHSAKNLIGMMIKNYDSKNLVRYVFIRVTSHLFISAYEFARMRPDLGTALIRSILWNLLNFEHLWKERLKVQTILRKLSDKEIMERVMMKPSLAEIFRKQSSHSVSKSLPNPSLKYRET